MDSKVLVVGDLHGMWGPINTLINKKKPDVVLQCGDFGYWPQLENSKSRLYGQKGPAWRLNGIKSAEPCSIYWCDGNHEDHWSLAKTNPNYKNEKCFVLYQPRGSVITLNGLNIMFIGGADSTDKEYRTLGIDWFPEEIIHNSDIDKCFEFKGKVDIVISHTCPESFKVISERDSWRKYNDSSRQLLQLVLERFKPDRWFFGHWHKYQEGIVENTRWTCLDYPEHYGRWYKEL